MKIGEAREIYSAKLNDMWEQRTILHRQQKKLEGDASRKEEYDSYTRQIEAIDKEYDPVRNFMQELMEYSNAIHNMLVSEQQNDAAEKAAQDELKCLEVARRIASGAKVPSSDVQKLMEYSMELYMAAVNAAAMNKHKDDKEYDSLWDDEEEGAEPETVDTEQAVNEMTCPIETPETGNQ